MSFKFLEPQDLPEGARQSCVILREKPHSSIDHVKHISWFRDLIKFRCDRNPLMLIDEVGLGLVLMIEQTVPRAFLVVSPDRKSVV